MYSHSLKHFAALLQSSHWCVNPTFGMVLVKCAAVLLLLHKMVPIPACLLCFSHRLHSHQLPLAFCTAAAAASGLGYGSFPPLTFPEAVLWILEMIFMAGCGLPQQHLDLFSFCLSPNNDFLNGNHFFLFEQVAAATLSLLIPLQSVFLLFPIVPPKVTIAL
jgi:hypothetical protein